MMSGIYRGLEYYVNKATRKYSEVTVIKNVIMVEQRKIEIVTS